MALKAQLARFHCPVYLAPIDVFHSAIVLAQQGAGATEAERI